MDFKNVEVDIGGQSFEEMDANPYELVIALSKKAREFNSKAMKYLGPETEIKPISVVLHKLYNEENIAFTYEKPEEPAEAAKPVRSAKKVVEAKKDSEDTDNESK